MILVTVGTQKFQMDRLLQAVDRIAQSGISGETFFVQSGYSTYELKYCEYAAFLEKEEMEGKIGRCSILLCHAGVGSILRGLKLHKKVIVVPRMQKFGEHVDDHQVEIAESFAQAGYIKYVENVSDLAAIMYDLVGWEPKEFVSNKEKFNQLILESIRE